MLVIVLGLAGASTILPILGIGAGVVFLAIKRPSQGVALLMVGFVAWFLWALYFIAN